MTSALSQATSEYLKRTDRACHCIGLQVAEQFGVTIEDLEDAALGCVFPEDPEFSQPGEVIYET